MSNKVNKPFLQDFAKAIRTDPIKADKSFYGVVKEIVEDESGKVKGYKISLGGEDDVIECRKFAGADIGDTVMITLMANGTAVVTGRRDGDGDAIEAKQTAEEADEKAQSVVDRANRGEFDGEDGLNGRGVLSIVEQWARGTMLAPDSTSWDTTPPTLTSQYPILWYRQKIDWTNPTETTYSPSASGVKSTMINELVTFRNLIANDGYTSINGSKIGAGTITLGGAANGDGLLEVYDSLNNLITKLSKDENIFAGFKIKAKYGRILLEDSGGMYEHEQSYWWLRSTDYEYEYNYFFEPIPTAQFAQYTFGNEFLYDSFDGWHQSNNKDFGSTAALDVIELDLAERTHLYMDIVDYNNETSNDYGTVGTIDGTALDETSTYSSTNSQVKWTGYNNHKQGGETIDFGVVSAGRHHIWIRYKKNSSVNNENDRLYFTLYTDKEDALVYEDDNKYTLMYISKTRIYQRKIIRNSENNMISYDVYKTLSRNGNIKSELAQSDYVSSGTKEIPLNSYESETNINGAALEFSHEGRNSRISFYGPAEPNGMYLFESGMNVFGEIDNNGFPIWNMQNSLVLANHDFATTVASGSQDGWVKTITKSGYYPLGVAGFGMYNDTGSGSSYARIYGCRLTARSLGSADLSYSIRADGGKVNNCKFRAQILWAKAYGDPG